MKKTTWEFMIRNEEEEFKEDCSIDHSSNEISRKYVKPTTLEEPIVETRFFNHEGMAIKTEEDDDSPDTTTASYPLAPFDECGACLQKTAKIISMQYTIDNLELQLEEKNQKIIELRKSLDERVAQVSQQGRIPYKISPVSTKENCNFVRILPKYIDGRRRESTFCSSFTTKLKHDQPKEKIAREDVSVGFPCQKEDCTKKFKEKRYMVEHFKREHLRQEKIYECSLCRRIFHFRSSFYRHRKKCIL